MFIYIMHCINQEYSLVLIGYEGIFTKPSFIALLSRGEGFQNKVCPWECGIFSEGEREKKKYLHTLNLH
jgi:hypothetical protein